jgi:hypothetical protein
VSGLSPVTLNRFSVPWSRVAVTGLSISVTSRLAGFSASMRAVTTAESEVIPPHHVQPTGDACAQTAATRASSERRRFDMERLR